ncbi:MAG: hypothetical protein K2W82_17950 [Candidatus Obscuribacterales bacterium]|nr:hypothetical protein [Candidatus Obscuribacterales bacterium]
MQQFWSRLYRFMLPFTVVVLCYLLYQEYQTREIAVTGARLETIFIQLRNTETLANATGNKEALKHLYVHGQSQYPGANEYFERAKEAYLKKDFALARIHITNTMHMLDRATRELMVATREAQEQKVEEKGK